jgi:hypothetical protein
MHLLLMTLPLYPQGLHWHDRTLIPCFQHTESLAVAHSILKDSQRCTYMNIDRLLIDQVPSISTTLKM